MKRFLFSLTFILAVQSSFSQQVYFAKANYTDSASLSKSMPVLANQLIATYKSINDYGSINDLFRLQLVAQQYEGMVASLKRLAMIDHGDSIAPTGLGFPYRL